MNIYYYINQNNRSFEISIYEYIKVYDSKRSVIVKINIFLSKILYCLNNHVKELLKIYNK